MCRGGLPEPAPSGLVVKDFVWHVLARHKRAAYPKHCAECRVESESDLVKRRAARLTHRRG